MTSANTLQTNECAVLGVDLDDARPNASHRLDLQSCRCTRRLMAAVKALHRRVVATAPDSSEGFLERRRLPCTATFFDLTFGYVWSPLVNSCTLALLTLYVLLSIFPKLFHIPSVSQCRYLSTTHTCNVDGAVASDGDINGRHLPVVGAMGLTIDNLGTNLLSVAMLVAAANSRYVSHASYPKCSLILALVAVEEAIRLCANAWADCTHCGSPPSEFPADAIGHYLGMDALDKLRNATEWRPDADSTAHCILHGGGYLQRGTAQWFAQYYALLWAYVLPHMVFNVSATDAFVGDIPYGYDDWSGSGWKGGPDFSDAHDVDCVVVSRMLLS